jgi:hypothetical protein
MDVSLAFIPDDHECRSGFTILPLALLRDQSTVVRCLEGLRSLEF